MKYVELPCVIPSTSKVLLGSGKCKPVKDLKPSDKIIDHIGQSRQISNVRKSKINVENDYTGLLNKTTQHVEKVAPFNFVYCKYNKWIPVHQLYIPQFVERVQPQFDLHDQFNLFWPMGFERVNDNTRFERKMVKVENVYEFGFLMAIFMTLGTIHSTTTTNPNITEYICERNNVFLVNKIVNYLKMMGIKDKYIKKTENNYHYSRLSVLSPNLRKIHEIILLHKRSLPHSFMTLDTRFNKGLYDGLIESNPFFYEKETHELALFASQQLIKSRQHFMVNRCDVRQENLDKNQNMYSIVCTSTDLPYTSLICEGIPLSTFP